MCVLACIAITAVVMFVGPFEHFSAADLNSIRAAERRLALACSGYGNEPAALRSLTILLGYFRRDPRQLLPLRGAEHATSMYTELTRVLPLVMSGPCARIPSLRERVAEALATDR